MYSDSFHVVTYLTQVYEPCLCILHESVQVTVSMWRNDVEGHVWKGYQKRQIVSVRYLTKELNYYAYFLGNEETSL